MFRRYVERVAVCKEIALRWCLVYKDKESRNTGTRRTAVQSLAYNGHPWNNDRYRQDLDSPGKEVMMGVCLFLEGLGWG